MLAFPPNYSLAIFLAFLGVISLFLYAPLRERLHPRYIMVIALVAALVGLPVYSFNQQQVTAYDVGTVIFTYSSWSFTIGSGEVERINDVSNIHTASRVYAMLYCNESVTFYLIDQNTPEIHYKEANYTQGYFGFILPYLYTEAGMPARWSVCLLNLNPIQLDVIIEPLVLEDSIETTQWNIQYGLYLPLALLSAIWMTLGLSLAVIHRRHIVSQGFLAGLLLIGPSIVIGVLLVMFAPPFLLIPNPFIALLTIPLFLIIRERKKKTPGRSIMEIE